MKQLLLLSLIVLAPVSYAASVTCRCTDVFCTDGEKRTPVQVDYNLNTQFFKIETSNWEFSGYAVRETSKVTGQTHITFPASFTHEPVTIEVVRDQKGSINLIFKDHKYECNP